MRRFRYRRTTRSAIQRIAKCLVPLQETVLNLIAAACRRFGWAVSASLLSLATAGAGLLPTPSAEGREATNQFDKGALLGLLDSLHPPSPRQTSDSLPVVPQGASSLELVTATPIASSIDTNADARLPTSISADGRYSAFGSEASNLVAEDTNGVGDIFVYDHLSGTLSRESVATGGTQGNATVHISGTGLSANGRFLVFCSSASNLAPGADGRFHIFLRDRVDGTTTLVSKSSAGAVANGTSFFPKITPDGRYIVYSSIASNLVSGDTNGVYDLFRHDVLSGETLRISLASSGAQGDRDSFTGFPSDNGQVISFFSLATNLVAGDTNGAADVFVRDLKSQATTRVSVAAGGGQLPGQLSATQWDRAISSGGRYVVFDTLDAAEPGDANGQSDVYRHDRVTGTTSRVSLGSGGVEGNASSFVGVLSGDGQKVLFTSFANNLVDGDTNGREDVFVRDIAAGTTDRLAQGGSGFTMTPDAEVILLESSDEGGSGSDRNRFVDVFRSARSAPGLTRMSVAPPNSVAAANDHSDAFDRSAVNVGVSDDARFVTFVSPATNLVLPATAVRDLFVRDMQTGSIERISRRSNGLPSTCRSEAPAITPDGRYVVFENCAGLVPPFLPGEDVYRYDRQTATLTLVSLNLSGSPSRNSVSADVSDDGNVVAFFSCAPDIVVNDGNGACDVFVRDLAAGTTQLASRRPDGFGASSGAASQTEPRISGNGRFVAFTSFSSELVNGDLNGTFDAFVFDRQTSAVQRVSLGIGGTELNNVSTAHDINRDGSLVAFGSRASNVGAGSTSSTSHLYVRDTTAATTVLVSRRSDGVLLNEGGSGASISAEGDRVGFASYASNYDPSFADFNQNAFTFDLLAQRLTLISRPAAGGVANDQVVGSVALSANGQHMVFASRASNLVANDGNNRFADVFLARNLGTAAPSLLFSNGFE